MIVTAPDYRETWREGISIFHNPRAVIALNPDLFPDVTHHFFDEGLIRSLHPEFHPLSSWTLVQVPDWARAPHEGNAAGPG
ncbi:MAG TPA: hypothetical protein VMT03_01855 [Polyangia bacterium]|nr:hypothetical protein [Polyangia bacterium]